MNFKNEQVNEIFNNKKNQATTVMILQFVTAVFAVLVAVLISFVPFYKGVTENKHAIDIALELIKAGNVGVVYGTAIMTYHLVFVAVVVLLIIELINFAKFNGTRESIVQNLYEGKPVNGVKRSIAQFIIVLVVLFNILMTMFSFILTDSLSGKSWVDGNIIYSVYTVFDSIGGFPAEGLNALFFIPFACLIVFIVLFVVTKGMRNKLRKEVLMEKERLAQQTIEEDINEL